MICDQFARDDRRFVVIHSSNQGVAAARNLGICRSRGEYIVFVDSDDWLGENYIRDMEGTEADYLCQQFSICNETGIAGQEYDLQCEDCRDISPRMIADILQRGGARFPFSKRFKRNLIIQSGIRFEETIDHSEDTLFIIDYLFSCQNAVFQQKANYFYVRYGTRKTLSNSISLERLTAICRAKGMIAGRLYAKGSREYEDLYYNLIGFPYMSYQWSVYFTRKRSFLEEFYFGVSFMRNHDVRRVIACAPDAIWTLPVSQRMIRAFQKNDKSALFVACIAKRLHRR